MNLNKWLCKTFDKDKKGYVNLGDIGLPIVFYGGITYLFGLFILYPIYVFISNGAYWNPGLNNQSPANIGGTEFTILIFILFLYICYIVSKIKVAKCPLKEDEKND